MFKMSMIEMVCIVSSALAASMLFVLWNSILSDLEKTFSKFEIERNSLKKQVTALTSNLEELESQKNNQLSKKSSIYSVNSSEINDTLVAENRKLHVRCDMLEEEINKLLEKPLVSNSKKYV